MRFAGRAQQGFERWARFVIRWRWAVAGASVALGLALAAGLARLEVDFSQESFLLQGDDAWQTYDAFKKRYGDDEFILVGIRPPAVFDLRFLAKLRDLHDELEHELPHVDELTSLINARDTRGEGDVLVVGELFDDWPRTEADLLSVRERVRDNPVFMNRLVSRDHGYTAIMIRLDAFSARDELGLDEALGGFEAGADDAVPNEPAPLSTEEQWEALDALYDVVSDYEGPDFEVSISGGPVIMHHMMELNRRDVKRYSTTSLVLIFLLLFFLFRRITATLIPLFIVVLSAISTFGAMGWLGIPVSMVTQSVPSFLLAVAVCDSMHILALVYRGLAAGKARDEALVAAFGHSGLAVVLTTLTTAGGLTSFRAAELAPIRDLGLVSPLGVLLALFFSLTTLPALLAIVPLRAPRSAATRESGGIGLIDRLLQGLGNLAIHRPRSVVAASLALVAVAGIGIANLRASNSAMDWFFADDPVRRAVERIEEEFEGIQAVEVLVDSGAENGLHDPDLLARLDAATREGLSLRVGPVRVAAAVSIVDVVKESHRALHANRPAFYAVPEDRELVAQELLLFENGGSDDLERLVDTGFRHARLTFQSNWADGGEYRPFLARLEQELAATLGPGVEFVITGDQSLFARSFSLLIPSLVRSYVLALAIITPLMILLVGDWRLGLLAMVPNLLPVYLTLGLMGTVDFPIAISTLIIGSMVLGIAVDDTIHFMHKFNQYSEEGLDTAAAIRATLSTTGVALLATSLALGGSYLVFLMASFQGLLQFGTLASFAVGVAFLADMLLAPALLVLFFGKDGAVQSARKRSQ